MRQSPEMNVPAPHGKTLALLGTALQIVPVASLRGADGALVTTLQSGLGDPRTLVGGLGEFSEVSAVGLAVGSVGLVLLAWAVAGSRYRAPWFFWFLVIYAGLIMPVFPVGTAFALFFHLYCLTRPKEFFTRPALTPVGP